MNDTSPLPGTKGETGGLRFETAVVGLLIAIFLLGNILTAEKSPTVWCDEVMYADPAVNLLQGHGFVSGTWYVQNIDGFWAGNVPLFQFGLFVWMKIFGFSLVAVRSFHYALLAAAMGVLWVAIRRLGLIPSRAWRVGFCVLLGCASSTSFVYRSARPESLCILLAALVMFSGSLPQRTWRLGLMLFLGYCLVWTGLQMAAYAAVMGGLLWLFARKRFGMEIISLGVGCAAGLGLLFGFYSSLGVWNDFVESIRQHTIATRQLNVPIGGYGTFAVKLQRLPQIYMDYSALPVLLLGWTIGVCQWWRGAFQWKLPLGFGVAAGVMVPLALFIPGVYPFYYYWMSFLPMSVGVFSALANGAEWKAQKVFNFGAISLLTAAALVGLPRRLLVASGEWNARSYAPVMQMAAPQVATDSFVYSEFAAYYAAKQHSARVLSQNYLPGMRDEEKSRVTVAILRSDVAHGEEWLAGQFGGVWRDTGSGLQVAEGPKVLGMRDVLGSRQYNLKVFQRKAQ